MRTLTCKRLITLISISLISCGAFAADTEKALSTLKEKLLKNGDPAIEGEAEVGDKKVPKLSFGKRLVHMKYDVVDDVKKAHGGTATIFVKSGSDFVRVSTNVLKDDGTRAVGTVLAKNKAYDAVTAGGKFCGEVEILGSPYDTCYEAIKAKDGSVVGVYYVGFKK